MFRFYRLLPQIVAKDQFGPKYLKTWWDRVCINLGVEGVENCALLKVLASIFFSNTVVLATFLSN